MILAGVDLAWQTDRNPSAIAFGRLSDQVLTVTSIMPAVYGTDEVLRALAAHEDLAGIAIDAPLIIMNAAGQRDCERAIGRAYGAKGAACHTANTGRYADARSVHLSRQLAARGFRHLGRDSWQIECYPHPAVIELFDLPRRLPYKKGTVALRRDGQCELARLIGSLRTARTLKLIIETEHRAMLDVDRIANLGGRALKSNEDALDSLVCLYIAGLYGIGASGVTFGDEVAGYIWVPSGPTG